VVRPAEQREVAEVGGAAVAPGDAVVPVGPFGGFEAPREAAAAVAGGQGAGLGAGGVAAGVRLLQDRDADTKRGLEFVDTGHWSITDEAATDVRRRATVDQWSIGQQRNPLRIRQSAHQNQPRRRTPTSNAHQASSHVIITHYRYLQWSRQRSLSNGKGPTSESWFTRGQFPRRGKCGIRGLSVPSRSGQGRIAQQGTGKRRLAPGRGVVRRVTRSGEKLLSIISRVEESPAFIGKMCQRNVE
jgi:hypothetical protein